MGIFGLNVRSATPPETDPIKIPNRAAFGDSDFLGTISVYRAIALLALGAGQFTLDVWRGSDLLERPSIVRKPDVVNRHRFRAFTKRTTASMATTGNAYWELTHGDRNQLVNVKVLNPHECDPRKDGRLGVAGRDRPLNPDQFRHLGLLWVPGRLKALGPIEAARLELTGQVNVTRYGSEFFDTGDIPSGLLKSDQTLTSAQAAEAKRIWKEREGREVAVLGHGLDYKPFLLSPEDAQFVGVRQFDTTAVARLFGIPARLFLAVVEGGSSTYANLAQDDLSFTRWSLGDYLGEMEDAWSDVLAGTQEARFNLDAGLRPDTKTRYEAHKLAIDAGWKRRSEVRADEGLPVDPDIDTQPVTQPKGADHV